MLRLVVLLIWLPLAAFAQSFPDPLSDKVSDYANLISPEAETRIGDALQAARDETGVHIVVATIDRQADYGGTGRFADFATGWFNAWGIGDKTRNDGILILVGRSDREMRIVLGDAYDAVWDGGRTAGDRHRDAAGVSQRQLRGRDRGRRCLRGGAVGPPLCRQGNRNRGQRV